VASKGLDFDAIHAEYLKNDNSLTDETLAKLAEVGIGEEVVQRYIDGQTALAKSTRAELAATIGGEESLGKVLKWAKDTDVLAEEEKEGFDALMRTGTPAQQRMFLRSLKNHYDMSGAEDAPMVETGTARDDGSSDIFRSQQEVSKAMVDRRYRESESYRLKIDRKIERSMNYLNKKK
jgi:predicted extracellular nuclease